MQVLFTACLNYALTYQIYFRISRTGAVADLEEGFRWSETPLNSGNNYADRLEQLGWLAKSAWLN